jgi:hypothetical protein
MTSIHSLPDEVLDYIVQFIKPCKQDQNFYINRLLYRIYYSRIKRCQPIIIFNKGICKYCHSDATRFISGFRYL